MLNEEQNSLEGKGGENKNEKETPLKGIHSKIPSLKQALKQTISKIKSSKEFFKQFLHNKKALYRAWSIAFTHRAHCGFEFVARA